MADKKPLWEVMIAAGSQGKALNGRVEDGEAARLRAIADVVVPEEPKPADFIHSSVEALIASAQWEQRMATRALLLAEAERAEKGASPSEP